MNLTHDCWIPVLWRDGRSTLVSLHEAFAHADQIRDLSAKPHEKIALLRLLICIAQAALDGPKDFDAWETCRDAIPQAAEAYLAKWRDSFELFGEGARFLQVRDLKMGKDDAELNPATKLDITLATGNEATIFDNSGGGDRPLSPVRLALVLLAFQCFSPGGTIGVARWNGDDTPGNGSSSHAPCLPSGMLHTFVTGDCLLSTIHWNLLDKESGSDLGSRGWGKPLWELPVSSLADKQAIANATESYLGRLVPMSRSIRLMPDGRGMVLGNGIEFPTYPIFREPAATLVERKEEHGVLGASLARSMWRQLPAITVKGRSRQDTLSGPVALNNVTGEQDVTLWIGALCTKKAKFEDLVEAAFDVPAGMFRDDGHKLYEEGVALADSWAKAVSRSTVNYWVARSRPIDGSADVESSFKKASKAEKERLRKLGEQAEPFFWTAIEQHVPVLLQLAAAPEKAGPLVESAWGRAARSAAHEAYEFACAHQTPRQIEAFAIGRQQLHLPKPKSDAKTAANAGKSKIKTTTP